MLPLPALFISIASTGIAWNRGEVMQELARQNENLTEANAIAYVQAYCSVRETGLRTPAFCLTMQNQGEGPARLRKLQ